MDIHVKSVDMDMDGKFHIHSKPVNLKRPSSSRGCWHIELQKFWDHDLDVFRSPDVIRHVTIELAIWSFLQVVL